jgi:hypothetical protein
MRYGIIFLSVLFLFLGCKKNTRKEEKVALARVQDKYLYASELEGVVPSGLTSADSLAMIKDYVDKWIRKELMLSKAEENLSDKQKDVEKQIDEYRTSLLIYKYEQSLIQQKLDTVVNQNDIENYYMQNTSNFILNKSLVKALYIKIPRNAPDIWKVRSWYVSDKEEHIKDLDAYCYKYASKYDYFNEDWVFFDDVSQQMPNLGSSVENTLKYRKNIEAKDSTYQYFLRLYDYKLEGTVAPLEFVKSDIITIILNKRKIQYINELETQIFNDARNHGSFNIY